MPQGVSAVLLKLDVSTSRWMDLSMYCNVEILFGKVIYLFHICKFFYSIQDMFIYKYTYK